MIKEDYEKFMKTGRPHPTKLSQTCTKNWVLAIRQNNGPPGTSEERLAIMCFGPPKGMIKATLGHGSFFKLKEMILTFIPSSELPKNKNCDSIPSRKKKILGFLGFLRTGLENAW